MVTSQLVKELDVFWIFELEGPRLRSGTVGLAAPGGRRSNHTGSAACQNLKVLSSIQPRRILLYVSLGSLRILLVQEFLLLLLNLEERKRSVLIG